MRAPALTLFGLLSLLLCVVHASNNWSGANSYFLWALSDGDRAAHLTALKNANINIVRIFVVHIDQGAKESSASGIPDLEDNAVGSYQTQILSKIDKLMYECSQKGLKLNIALHDRYSTGWWQSDGYSKKYPGGRNPVQFYSNSNAQNDFDNRLRFLLKHQNPFFGNRTWGNIPEAVWAFGIQNEAMSYMSWSNPWTWHCNRAKVMRPLINSKILITTGGGANWADSLQVNNYKCPQIDVIGLHSYDGAGALKSNLPKAIQLAQANGKRVIYEEFGNTGNQQGDISSEADICNQMGVPWFPWQFVRAKSGDFEYYVGSGAWNTHVSKAQDARNSKSVFDWNMGASNGTSTSGGGGGSGGLGDWAFCSTSSQCTDGCCSKQYSNDGKMKCTPGGTQCA